MSWVRNLPMGFETRKWRDDRRDDRRVRNLPMGFETWRYYHGETTKTVRNLPMGFETWRYYHGETTKTVRNLPMGFETGTATSCYDGPIYCSKPPYGI